MDRPVRVKCFHVRVMPGTIVLLYSYMLWGHKLVLYTFPSCCVAFHLSPYMNPFNPSSVSLRSIGMHCASSQYASSVLSVSTGD